jgi:hypothetical protein
MSCSVEGCDKENKRKDLCESHYYKMFRKIAKEFNVDDYWLFIKKELKIG